MDAARIFAMRQLKRGSSTVMGAIDQSTFFIFASVLLLAGSLLQWANLKKIKQGNSKHFFGGLSAVLMLAALFFFYLAHSASK